MDSWSSFDHLRRRHWLQCIIGTQISGISDKRRTRGAIVFRCTCGSCRYLDRAVADPLRRGAVIDEQRLRRLSPLGRDHINLTGDYVWSESATYDASGLRPLNSEPDVV